MGAQACCADKSVTQDGRPSGDGADAVKIFNADDFGTAMMFESYVYKVTLHRPPKTKLGIDVDYLIDRKVLPILSVDGGAAGEHNSSCDESQKIRKGDAILDVNGQTGDAVTVVQGCTQEGVLKITFVRNFCQEYLVADIEKLIREHECGPELMRLSFNDASVFSTGALTGGCANAALRLQQGGESTFEANAGLMSTVNLLKPISNKYVPNLISHADLWVLCANMAIKQMGGPDIKVRYRRKDAATIGEGVASQAGRLPDPEKGAEHLRDIFHPKGCADKDIVALMGQHTVGTKQTEISGHSGAWTEDPLTFDNSYFKALLTNAYKEELVGANKKKTYRCEKTGTSMDGADMALLDDPSFRVFVEKYAANQAAFFEDFAEAWQKMQEKGLSNLQAVL